MRKRIKEMAEAIERAGVKVLDVHHARCGHLKFKLATEAGTHFSMNGAVSPSASPATMKNMTSRARERAKLADERAKKGPR